MNSYSVSRACRGVEQPLFSRFALLALGAAIFAWPGASRGQSPGDPESPQALTAASVDDPASTSADEYARATALVRARNWEEAIPLLRAALSRDPESEPVLQDLARALAFTGHRAEALRLLNQQLRRETGSGRAALIRRIRLLSRLFLTNANFQLHQDGINLMLLHKYKPARERLEKALEQEPDNVEVLTRLGQCLLLDGEYKAAVERLRLARGINPYEPEIRLWLGRALDRSGDSKAALVELKAVLREMPASETAVVWLAEALESQGQRDRAIDALDDDLRHHPTHVWALITESRLRLEDTPSRDAQTGWLVRKNLQLALSRIQPYLEGSSESTSRINPAGSLGVDLRMPEGDLRKEIEHWMGEAESRINLSHPSEYPPRT